MPKCPYCGNSEGLVAVKSLRFRSYNVTMYKCPRCGGTFNHYVNASSKGRPEFLREN